MEFKKDENHKTLKKEEIILPNTEKTIKIKFLKNKKSIVIKIKNHVNYNKQSIGRKTETKEMPSLKSGTIRIKKKETNIQKSTIKTTRTS
jgi:hypothetical protein